MSTLYHETFNTNLGSQIRKLVYEFRSTIYVIRTSTSMSVQITCTFAVVCTFYTCVRIEITLSLYHLRCTIRIIKAFNTCMCIQIANLTRFAMRAIQTFNIRLSIRVVYITCGLKITTFLINTFNTCFCFSFIGFLRLSRQYSSLFKRFMKRCNIVYNVRKNKVC